MLRHTVAVIAALALITAACGGSPDSNAAQSSGSASPASAAPQSRDACALITAEEVEKILGSPATVTSRSESAQRSVCDYVTKAYESFTLEVTWQGADDEIKTARTAATAATAAAGGKADQIVNDVMGLHKVENLGDEAYFSRRTMSYVRKGDVLLTFQNAGLNDPAAREHWEALARAAVARL
jgi:ABC-type glycerol-3-phosphate transport system substrate-binding protein